MKYLSRREDFLRSTKLIETKTDILKEVYPLNEGTGTGGPFYNEDAFYDTALGRLFSHVIRKVGIMANLVRIRPVIRRLEYEFNRLAIEGIVENLETEEERIGIYRVQISSLYQALVMLVDNEGNVGEIKFTTDSALSLTNELLEKPVGKEMKLNVPKKELEDFKEFLKQFKDDEGGKESEEEEEEESDNDDNNLEISNLMALKGILEGLKSFELAIAAGYSEVNKKGNRTLSQGDTLQKISQETGIDIETLKSKNNWMVKYKPNDALPTKDKDGKLLTLITEEVETNMLPSDPTKGFEDFLKKLKERILKMVGAGGNEDVEKAKILKALSKYRDSIKALSDNNKMPVTIELIKDILNNKEKYGKNISVLYREIKEYMVGKKKATLNYTPDKLIEAQDLNNKQVGDTLGEGSPEIIEVEGKKYYVSDMAWKISKFALRVYQVNDAQIYDVLSAVSEPTKNFVNTLKQLNNKIEAKKESRLLKYIGFKLIREADDTQTSATASTQSQVQSQAQTDNTEPNAVTTGTVSERIKDFFDKNCKTVRTYVMEKAEIIKICENFDKITEQKKETFIIPGMDPIIQIVRLFNRAYKLHTVPTISKRTGGKVSPTVYKEYTSFGGRSSGGDSLNGWAGPFRNNKIFNLWEDAVLSIMGNRKYEFIFTTKTKLRIPKVPNPVKKEDYEFREGAGAKLRTFMNDMLDGDELYKDGTTQGAQKRFIEKYFGELKDGEVKDTTIPGSDDATVNSGTSTAISSSTQIAKFTKNEIVNAPWKKGMVFAALTTESDKDGNPIDTTRYFMIEGPNAVSFCKSMFFYDKLITKSENADSMDGRKWKVEKGDLSKMEERAQGTDKFEMRYTKDKKALDQIFKKDNKLSITYNTGANKDTDNTKSFKIKEIFWLGTIGEDKKFKPFELNIKPESYKKIRTQYGSGSPLVASENVSATLTSNNRLKIDVSR